MGPSYVTLDSDPWKVLAAAALVGLIAMVGSLLGWCAAWALRDLREKRLRKMSAQLPIRKAR